MQRKVRFYRIQLLAYDVVDTPLWSLPLIGPSPTPMPLDEPAFTMRRSSSEAALYQVRFPRKIQLLPLDD
jgi:hypothetical protein